MSAVLNALLTRLEEGKSREMEFRRVSRYTTDALTLGLSKRKALAVGHLLPEANQFDPLLAIKQTDPELTPDLELNVPVRSPATGENYVLRVMLP